MKRHLRNTLAGGALALSLASFPLCASAQQSTSAVARQWTGFSSPTGIASRPDGTVYVSNWGGGTVEQIKPDGSRSVFLSDISSPAGIAIDGAGYVFVSSYSDDYIVRVAPDGTIKRIVEGLATPTGIAFAANGRLLVANRASGEILSIDSANGQKRIIARSLSLPVGVVEMQDGSIVASQYGGRVTRILNDGSTQELGQSFSGPGVGIVADGPDAVLVIDNGASLVRRVSFDGQSRSVTQRLDGSAVALGRAASGDLLIGTWGTGAVYRVAAPQCSIVRFL